MYSRLFLVIAFTCILYINSIQSSFFDASNNHRAGRARGGSPSVPPSISACVQAICSPCPVSPSPSTPPVGPPLGCSSTPTFGTAQTFAILASSTITSTGAVGTVVTGNVGVSTGTAVTGFPPGVIINGTIHSNDMLSMNAQTGAQVLHSTLLSCPCTTDLTGQDLGGLTLTPGVYCYSSSAELTGTVTLDAGGNPDAIFIIRMGSTITTASAAVVSLVNGAAPCNVFWDVGSSATIGTGTTFQGVIIAVASITVTTGSSVAGRLFALNAAVTLDANPVTVSFCEIV